MKKIWFIVSFLLFSQLLFAELRPGINCSDQYLWIVLKPGMENVRIAQTRSGVVSGMPAVDERFRRFEAENARKEVPFATADDRTAEIDFRNVYRVKIAPGQDILKAAAEFEKAPDVVIAEPVPVYHVEEVPPFQPNDPYLTYQWHLAQIKANYAWGMWGGELPLTDSVVVAILDTGVDWNHPDLLANIYVNPGEDIDGDGVVGDFGPPSAGGDEDSVDNDGNGYVDDLIGWDFCGADPGVFVPDNDPHSSVHQGYYGMLMHGTHVAGCASPVTNNGTGVAGPGFNARILPVKVAFDNDINNTPGVYASASAYIYAAKAGADILNCSFGGTGYSAVIKNAITLVHDTYGAIVVAASGNENLNLQNSPHYPSDYPNVIAVAASNSSDRKADFSNYGPSIDITAPGVNMWSTIYQNVSGGYQGPGWQGTSMASPVVAGSYALLKAFFPDKPNTWLEQRLLDAADPIDDVNASYAGMLGSGRVNLYSAIAQGILPSLRYKSYSLQISGDEDGQLNPGESALLRVTLQNDPGWHEAGGISAVLRCPSGNLIISDSTATFQNIAGGSIGINLIDRFEFTVDSLSPIGMIPVELRVKANQDSVMAYDIMLNFDIEVGMNQTGWPQVNTGAIQSSPAAVDINGDGQKEVIVTSTDSKLYVWMADGTPAAGFPLTTGGQIISSPAVADIDGDGYPEIAVTSKDNHLYLVNHDGTVLLDYNAGTQLWGTPALADVDGDADLEIAFGDFNGKLHLINYDGSAVANFPLDLTSAHRILGGVSVSDLNGDSVPDLVFGTFNGDVYGVSTADGSVLSGFPVNVGMRVQSGPAIADPDGSGPLGKQMFVSSINKKITVIDGQGNITAAFTYPDVIESQPSLADVNEDGTLDILFGCNDNKLYAVDMSGTNLPGFPIVTGNDIKNSPVIADVTGDGHADIAFVNAEGKFFLVNGEGILQAGFPIDLGGLLKATPTVDDLDGDGDQELMVGSVDALHIFDMRGSGSNAGGWFTQQANYRRTGTMENPLTGMPSGGEEILPRKYRLDQNYPNPFNPETRISFSLAKQQRVELYIFNLLGQRVRTLVSDVRPAGDYHVTWDGRNDHGTAAPSGIYFYRIQTADFSSTRKMMLLK